MVLVGVYCPLGVVLEPSYLVLELLLVLHVLI